MTDSTQPQTPAPDQERVQPKQSTPRTEDDAELYAFPLSPVQERMWHAFLQNPKSPIYNASFRWQLEGMLDARLIELSFEEIIRRHEVLRAHFGLVVGEPRQLIAPELKVKIARTDLSGMPAAERDTEFDRMSAIEAQACFDLKTGPLLRIGLIRMEAKRHVLTLTLHHIICDGWSIGIIMEELQKIYAAFAEGRPSPLPELPIQYGDFVMWQQEFLQRDEIRQQLVFWKKKLDGYTRLEVRGDLPRSDEADRRSAIVSALLPRELSEKLKEFSNQQGGTLFITTLAANVALLHAETGQTDIVIGSPLAGRNRSDLESLIGAFINHVVFRVNAGGDPTFADLALRVRDTVWDAFANQDVPFEEVVREVAGERGSLADAFYVVNYICQREYARASTFVFEFAGLRMSTLPSKSQGALYDLNFFMVEREAGWRLSLEYRVPKYSEDCAKRLHNRFHHLLNAIAQNPNRRLSELMRTMPDEAAKADAKDVTEASSAPADFHTKEEEVYALPASVAQERFWLLEKVNQGNTAFHMPAAVRLTGRISTERLEAALKKVIARHEVLRTTFDDSNGDLMQIISPSSPFRLGVTELALQTLTDREATLDQAIRQESELPFDLAKGPLFRARLFEIAPEEHVLLITLHHILADGWSQSILQKELWTAYEADDLSGDAELPPLNIQYSDFAAWQKEWLQSEDAEAQRQFWLKALAAPLTPLEFPTDRPRQSFAPSHGALETYLIPHELGASLRNHAQTNNATMFTLMLAAFGVLLARYSGQDDVIVGSPVANRRPETEPLIGPFAGPIALRLNLTGDPTLTQILERVKDFVLDALSHTDLPFEDLLQHLELRSAGGRNSLFRFYFFYQAAFLQSRKVGGMTVSPLPTFSVGTPFDLQFGLVERSEGIRIQLEYNPDLFDASTIKKMFDYYVVLLRKFLETPETVLSRIDRPEISSTASQIKRHGPPLATRLEQVPPADESEIELLRMWCEALRCGPIGVTDNFFDLGGYSLSASKLLIAVEKRFKKKMPLATLFEAPTVREFALLLQGTENQTFGGRILRVRGGYGRTPLMCVDGGPIYLPLARNLGNDRALYGLRLENTEQFSKPYRIEDIAGYHIETLRKIQPKGPYLLGGWCLAGVLAYEMARQLTQQGELVELVAMFDSANPAYLRRFNKLELMVRRTLFWGNKTTMHTRRLVGMNPRKAARYLWERVGSLKQAARRTFWRLSYEFRNEKTQEVSEELKDASAVVYLAARAYQPGPYDGRVALFRSALEPMSLHRDPKLGWKELIPQLEVEEIPGDHRQILEEPAVAILAQAMNARLLPSASHGTSQELATNLAAKDAVAKA